MSQHQIFNFVRRLSVIAVIKYLIIFHLCFVNGDVSVINFKNFTIAYFEDREGQFGPSLSEYDRTGFLIYANPRNACEQVDPPPGSYNRTYQWILLIARGECDFAVKVINAQRSGYIAAIIHNYKESDDLVPMSGGDRGGEVVIPSVFIGGTDGENLAQKYCYTCQKSREGYYHITLSEPGGPPSPYLLWPFAVVVGTCFILMLTFMVFKWCRDIRRKKKSRLSSKHLKKIPVKKFKKGDEYDVCAICLDDYEEGEKMRILPCSHAYHCKCIDPWLTKNKRTCPVCKRKVFPGSGDSESDSEADENINTSVSERTPLLAESSSNGQSSSRRSTFESSGLPETVRPHITVLSSSLDEGEESDSDSSLELGAVGGVQEPRNFNDEEFVVVEPQPAQMNDGFSSDENVAFSEESKTEVKKLNQVV